MSSVVFSITIVALSLAAGQFGSRLIRIYLTSVRTKLALGLFTMTIAYCLLGLCYVEQDMSPAQVPQVAVTLAAALAMSCVFALLLFLHFVARSMIADEVIRRSASELEKSIEAMPPFEPGAVEPEPAEVLPADFDNARERSGAGAARSRGAHRRGGTARSRRSPGSRRHLPRSRCDAGAS